jgi:starch synthase
VCGIGTGFKFSPYTPEALLAALGRALDAHHDPAAWAQLVRNGMAQDFSWDRAAAEYRRLYKEVLAEAQ